MLVSSLMNCFPSHSRSMTCLSKSKKDQRSLPRGASSHTFRCPAPVLPESLVFLFISLAVAQMLSRSGLSWNLPWAQRRSLGPCGPRVPCLPPTTSEGSVPYDCSVSGELPQGLLVRAGRGGQKPQGVGIQGNNLTCATIAFIARGWRLYSFP